MPAELRPARREIEAWARAVGLPDEARYQLVLAFNGAAGGGAEPSGGDSPGGDGVDGGAEAGGEDSPGAGGGGIEPSSGTSSGQIKSTAHGAWSTTNRVCGPRLRGPSRRWSPSRAHTNRLA